MSAEEVGPLFYGPEQVDQSHRKFPVDGPSVIDGLKRAFLGLRTGIWLAEQEDVALGDESGLSQAEVMHRRLVANPKNAPVVAFVIDGARPNEIELNEPDPIAIHRRQLEELQKLLGVRQATTPEETLIKSRRTRRQFEILPNGIYLLRTLYGSQDSFDTLIYNRITGPGLRTVKSYCKKALKREVLLDLPWQAGSQ